MRDPFFTRPSRKYNLSAKDYTKYIRWTPKRIAIFAIALGLPYAAIVVVIAIKLGIGAAIFPVVLAAMIGGVAGLLHWISKISV